MKFKKTKINGLYLIEVEPIIDDRGFFARTFCQNDFSKKGITFNIVQSNLSLNKIKGTLRGMHFQKSPKAENKIVQCLKGNIYDVVIDLRPDSPTFNQWVAEELNDQNQKMFLIPKGCAHGFQTLTNNCLIQYLMSEFYSPKNASGVRWNDPIFNIYWPLKPTIMSEKDKNWPLLKLK